MYMICFTVLSS